MALIECKECLTSIAESAKTCPKCGFEPVSAVKDKSRFEAFLNFLGGPFVVPAATAILGCMTLLYQERSHENEKLQTMIESAVSGDSAKERSAVQTITYLAKHREIEPSFALSILGTVVRDARDEQLRGEVYDALENLAGEDSNLKGFDKYERLEILCLRASLTPSQFQRQKNIHAIEKFVTNDELKVQASSKLLSLVEHLSDPQSLIDLLLSVSAYGNKPDMLEKVIPSLCKAVKLRDHFGNESNEDVVNFLMKVAVDLKSDTAVTQSIAQDESYLDVKETSRLQMRLYLARALVAKAKKLRDDSLTAFENIVSSHGLGDDARLLLDGIGRTTEDPNLPTIVKTVNHYLDGEKDVGDHKFSTR
jgi:hypothetical protein